MTALAQIAIAVKHVTPELKKTLQEGMLYFRNAGYEISITERNVDSWVHFMCELEKNGGQPDCEATNLFSVFLAENLAAFVMREQVEPYCEELLSHYYFYFPRSERKEILALAQEHYWEEQERSAGAQVHSKVNSCIKEFLHSNSYVNLHGLISFRLRPWLEFLRKNLDKAVDDYLMEKEYQEFIKLLKYFVALQEPKIKEVHVTIDVDGHIQLLNSQYQPIERVKLDIEWDGVEGENNEEDQLISLLITVAPYRLVLHKLIYTMYPKAADTLKHVFEKRVTLCKQCKVCHNINKHMTQKGK